MFKMSVNVCPDDTFWTAQHFVTRHNMVVQHHELECHAGKKCLLSWRSASQWGLIWSKYDFFLLYLLSCWFFGKQTWSDDTPHKSECLVKKWNYCVQGRGHFEGSNCQLMSVQMISSKLLNMLLPNLVLWCIIMSWNVMQKDWFAIFKVKVTARANMIKIWQFLLYRLNCWSFCYQTLS